MKIKGGKQEVSVSNPQNKKPCSDEQDIYNKITQYTVYGGDKRDRTADLLNAIQALSQLSYTPIYVKGVYWVICLLT